MVSHTSLLCGWQTTSGMFSNVNDPHGAIESMFPISAESVWGRF
jgi:hypothetical protein